jgi:hypothetical protein
MATTRIQLDAAQALPVPSVTMPEFKLGGTNINVASYSFDAAGTEGVQFLIPYAPAYGSGNITAKLLWFGDSATSGDVVWGVAIAALTPETDSTDIETDSWATENTVTDSHLGTTAHRLHTASVTVSNLDSITTGDYLAVRVQRLGADGSDTMTGDAQLVGIVLEWSDT